ncbi:MAG: Uncharacterized protein G01um101466_478 [Parcubacteria group bacterium Gr01-1014_66]|nr:MAG: Uncharacterized protein G01um101466_478 [Parcubacteria group bacterium Gr01-1014_66]
MTYQRGAKNGIMKNWSTDIVELQKDKERFSVWRLEQLINFGLGEEKIDLIELRKYWDRIHIDPFKRKCLSLFV